MFEWWLCALLVGKCGGMCQTGSNILTNTGRGQAGSGWVRVTRQSSSPPEITKKEPSGCELGDDGTGLYLNKIRMSEQPID